MSEIVPSVVMVSGFGENVNKQVVDKQVMSVLNQIFFPIPNQVLSININVFVKLQIHELSIYPQYAIENVIQQQL